MPRTHDRADFYKFATTCTAKIIIQRRTIRWRTPLQFNDPFDTQTRLAANINADEFADRFTARISEIAFSENRPAFFDPDSQLHQMAMTLGKIPPNRRNEAVTALRQSAYEIAETLPEKLRELSRDVSAHLLHGRAFCLTETINNVVMWSHYAEEHRGVGFKFRVLDEIDHPFLIAKPVKYSDNYVQVGNAIELADHFTQANPVNLAELSWELVYLKHSDWKYEKEWRCYWPLLNEPQGTGYIDPVQDPRLFEAIYLGCCMPKTTATEIIALVRDHLPETKIYKAIKSESDFDLAFEEII